jgi:hypothetical protein
MHTINVGIGLGCKNDLNNDQQAVGFGVCIQYLIVGSGLDLLWTNIAFQKGICFMFILEEKNATNFCNKWQFRY